MVFVCIQVCLGAFVLGGVELFNFIHRGVFRNV